MNSNTIESNEQNESILNQCDANSTGLYSALLTNGKNNNNNSPNNNNNPALSMSNNTGSDIAATVPNIVETSNSNSSSEMNRSDEVNLETGKAQDGNTYPKVVSGSLTSDDLLDMLEEKVQSLLRMEDYASDSAYRDLKFIQRRTRYTSDVSLHKRTIDRLVRSGVAHVYLRIWQTLSVEDRYLSPQEERAFTILQTALSIIWNCSDSSPVLCESLARVAVVHLLLSELGTARLLSADLDSDERRRYLVKAYLGILHNVARLCADSRKMFRSADGVNVLRAYMDRPQGLVRTKAYLILSYIVTEEENDIINATDENLDYIVQILRSALQSENHYSVEFAFWAAEISCGLNHLAVNDSNKSRLCRLGLLPLYVKMLKGGACEESAGLSESVIREEQSLSADGLWILSFHAENKNRMRQSSECIDALQAAASTSVIESVARSARGALWVIGSSRPQSLVSVDSSSSVTLSSADTNETVVSTPNDDEYDDDDDSVGHVMISYHWASQRTMIKVKDFLVAQNYKVWMDIDNMSGSTLEAMALAVEKAAVILVCLSQGYKDSPSCRTEAEYTYRLRKDIVPLVLQAGYVPDGWLGILVGTRLYFDLSDPVHFDLQLERLAREIGARGQLNSARFVRSVSGYSSGSRAASRMSKTSSRMKQQSDTSGAGEDASSRSTTSSIVSPTSLHAYPSTNQQSASYPRANQQSITYPSTSQQAITYQSVNQQAIAYPSTNQLPVSRQRHSSLRTSYSYQCSTCSSVNETMDHPAFAWTRSDVTRWLESLQLSHLSQSWSNGQTTTYVDASFTRRTLKDSSLSSVCVFNLNNDIDDFDGILLLQYRRMMERAPQFFYHTLEDMLSLQLTDILQFTAALESLT